MEQEVNRDVSNCHDLGSISRKDGAGGDVDFARDDDGAVSPGRGVEYDMSFYDPATGQERACSSIVE